jgi:ribosome-binding factor A
MKQTAGSRKVNEAARSAIAQLLLTEVADPRLAFITVTGVEVSKDRSVANIHVSTGQDRYSEVERGLASAKGRLRSLLGRELGWRVTPELRFLIDTSVDAAARIDRALKEVPPTLSTSEDETDSRL